MILRGEDAPLTEALRALQQRFGDDGRVEMVVDASAPSPDQTVIEWTGSRLLRPVWEALDTVRLHDISGLAYWLDSQTPRYAPWEMTEAQWVDGTRVWTNPPRLLRKSEWRTGRPQAGTADYAQARLAGELPTVVDIGMIHGAGLDNQAALEGARVVHRREIRRALRLGRPVPEAVREEYEAAQARGAGEQPGAISVAIWTPEVNGDRGLEMALSNQQAWGGHVFVSSTRPGYVVWFDTSHTPSDVLSHEAVRGHDGEINPAPHRSPVAPQRRPWDWRMVDAAGREYRGVVEAVDPRDALARALTAETPEGQFLGDQHGIPITILSEAPGNADAHFETEFDGVRIQVSERAPAQTPSP